MTMSRLAAAAIAFAAINGAIAVIAGASAAHGLDARIGTRAVEWVRTASHYQLWHALALLASAILIERSAEPARRAYAAAVIAFAFGTALFSGSVYATAFGGPGRLAPVGGGFLIIGWLAMAAGGLLGLIERRG